MSKFDDAYAIGSAAGRHFRITSVTMGCAHDYPPYGIKLTYADQRIKNGLITTVEHGSRVPGKDSKEYQHMDLDPGEYITHVSYRTQQVKKGLHGPRTRISTIWFHTNGHKSLYCGPPNSQGRKNVSLCIMCALADESLASFISQEPKNLALLYFSGRSGDALDLLQAHWVPIEDY